jgi:hypothetical protein
MATYKDIQREGKLTAGFVPKTCWIAHSLEMVQPRPRRATNRVKPEERKYPCPAEKAPAIIAALYKLRRLSTGQNRARSI